MFSKKIILTICFFISTLQAHSAVLVQIKGEKAIVDFQSAPVQVGQQYQLVDSQNKMVGVIEIKSVKNGKGLAQVIKGRAQGKEKLVEITSVVKKLEPPELPRSPYRTSLLLGLASNTLSVKVTDGITSQTVDNTGNSLSLALAVDRQFQPWLTLRGLVGFDQFNAVGASTVNGCDQRSSKDCKTDINYAAFGLYVKYEKEFSQFRVWGALGFHLKHPISKKSTALDESSLGTTFAYAAVLGGDYVLESKTFLTLSLEKQFFIKSDSAEISTMMIRLGAGKDF